MMTQYVSSLVKRPVEDHSSIISDEFVRRIRPKGAQCRRIVSKSYRRESALDIPLIYLLVYLLVALCI